VLITIDVDGTVTEVELAQGAGNGFDEEALVAARKLRFTPAKVGGVPTPVKIRYTFRFRIPEKDIIAREPLPECTQDCGPSDERKTGTITLTVFERGRGKDLEGVEVYILDQDRVILTDADGKAVIEGTPGAYAFTIRPPGFYPYEAVERIEEGENLEVKYYVRRNRRARYQTIVWGSEGRAEVARTSLREDEIRAIPGTLGDPIRVAMLLPGVSSSVSGLGYPIIRGQLPGDSMYEIDGIQVPMLYHLLFGTAVIHPRFIDEITFQPGGYSAEHGRFPGGRIAATTTKVEDEALWVADLSIIQASLLRAQKLGKESDLVVAARYGTLGYIIEGLAANTVFRYWDYQTRLSHRFSNGGKLSLTVLGVQDTAGEVDPFSGEEDVLHVGFHKADLRYRQAVGDGWFESGVQVGSEFFRPPDEGEDDFEQEGEADMTSLRPYLSGGYSFDEDTELQAGADLLYQDFGLNLPADSDIFVENADTGITVGMWAALEWKLGPLVVNPSARFDHYRYDSEDSVARETAVDPRIAASYDVTKRLVVKASAGRFSGPTRFSFVEPPIVFGPIPAYEGPGLFHGLNTSWQYQAGIETKLPGDFELAVTGFYHDMYAPVDFSLIDKQLLPDDSPCDGDSRPFLVSPLDIDGRSFGGEVMLRRRLGNNVYGWTSYTLARSDRTIPDARVGTIPFDFDQTHVLNTVVSWEVGRNWTLGGVFHFNTGRARTPFHIDQCNGGDFFWSEDRRGAPNSDRFPNYWRIDVRIQKREVFDTWYFDFYIDFFNAAFQWETVDYTFNPSTGEHEPDEVPLFVPMIGIRGEF
jgi:TonB family protein